jgi:hypothetical protein
MAVVIAYKYEDQVEPGSALVAGAESGAVALPGEDGVGNFAGIYSAIGNRTKDKPGTADTLGLTLHGACRVKASGAVTAFAFGKVADETGAVAELAGAPLTPTKIPGFFMEDGSDGELVDFFVEPFLHPGA